MKQKTLEIFEYELPVKIEKDKYGGYVASSPKWKDCYAQGDTIDEVVSEITGVAASLIELYKEEDLKVPLKSSSKKSFVFNIPVITSA